MSHYTLTINKGDLALALSSEDADWIAQEIARWRQALLSIPVVAMDPAQLPIKHPPAFEPKNLKDPTRLEGSQTDEQDPFEAVFAALMEDVTQEETEDSPNDSHDLPQALPPALIDVVIDDPLEPVIQEEEPRFAVLAAAHTPEEELAEVEVLSEFAVWCRQTPPISPIQSLLWSSYYLTQQERLTAFDLVTLNALLTEAHLGPISHGTLQDALDDGLLALIPDTTGLETANRYQLTEAGLAETEQARQSKLGRAKPKIKR